MVAERCNENSMHSSGQVSSQISSKFDLQAKMEDGVKRFAARDKKAHLDNEITALQMPTRERIVNANARR